MVLTFEELRSRIRGLRQIACWPEMVAFLERAISREGSIWEYPAAACRAVGGSEETAVPAAAAILCSVASIRLVDDILDDDPQGDYRFIGAGPAANLALAFQAAGHLLLDDPAIPLAIRPALQACLAETSLATCRGQALDARELQSEEEYWQVVESKTPPLFAAALRMGALLGGAAPETAEGLARLGRIVGRYIQVSDDATDALGTPARADWQRRGNNLAILYAMTAPHPEREEFLRLSLAVEDPGALAAAQKILLRSGAISFCTLKLVEFSHQARSLLARLPLAEPAAVEQLVQLHEKPLHRLLESVGVDTLGELSLATGELENTKRL